MRLSVQTFICCCVFSTVLLRGASEEPSGPRRRLRGRLQNHVRRDPHHGVEITGELRSGRQEKFFSGPSSVEPRMRAKRSTSVKSSGCIFITCVYHDLVHRLYDLNNKQKEDKAPEEKMGCNGYGRRRRRRSARTQGKETLRCLL